MQLKRMLRNPFNRSQAMCGRRSWPIEDWVSAPSSYPAVWDEDQAAIVDQELKRRSTLRRGATGPHAWTGIACCAGCRGSMHCGFSRGTPYYRCNLFVNSVACSSRERLCHCNSTADWKIERVALAALEQVPAPEALDAALARLNDDSEERLRQQLKDAKSALAQVAADRGRPTTAYLRGVLSIDGYEQQMEQHALNRKAPQEQLALAKRALRELPDPEQRREELTRLLPQALRAIAEGSMSDEERRHFVRDLP